LLKFYETAGRLDEAMFMGLMMVEQCERMLGRIVLRSGARERLEKRLRKHTRAGTG